MARTKILLAALALALPLAAGAQPPPHSPYARELARQCPKQRLENMTAGDLELIMEDFGERLTAAETRTVQDAVGRRCARVEAGLSCANAATLDAYRRLGRLKAFVREACASGWTCSGFAECKQTKPQP